MSASHQNKNHDMIKYLTLNIPTYLRHLWSHILWPAQPLLKYDRFSSWCWDLMDKKNIQLLPAFSTRDNFCVLIKQDLFFSCVLWSLQSRVVVKVICSSHGLFVYLFAYLTVHVSNFLLGRHLAWVLWSCSCPFGYYTFSFVYYIFYEIFFLRAVFFS